MGMASMEKATAETILNPILAILEKCIHQSWDEWTNFYAPKHHILDSRARAAIVYCHTVDRAMELFRDVDGVTPGRKRGIFRLFIGDDIALRFKKAKRDGTTSNVSTNQQRLIDLQLKIPGVLPGTMLNAVYQLDDLQRDIARLMVTHQLDGKIVWHIDILEPLAAAPISVPQPAPPQPPTEKRARVKGKRLDKKASNQEG